MHNKWFKNPKYKEAYDELEDEFAVARALIETRTKTKLTQTEVAEQMETSQAAVARLDASSGKSLAGYFEALCRGDWKPSQDRTGANLNPFSGFRGLIESR